MHKTKIQNTKNILELYCPNLLFYINDKDIKKLIERSYNQSLKNKDEAIEGFMKVIFMLIIEYKENKATNIRKEFWYFNYLLGKALEILGDSKAFKELIISLLLNLKTNNFINGLSEIAVLVDCIDRENLSLLHYEFVLSNGKSIDLQLIDSDNNDFYIEILNIFFNNSKYESSNKFIAFIEKRLQDKFLDKTKGLNNSYTKKVYIAIVIHGLTTEIILENNLFFKNVNEYNSIFKCCKDIYVHGHRNQKTEFSFMNSKALVEYIEKYNIA